MCVCVCYVARARNSSVQALFAACFTSNRRRHGGEQAPEEGGAGVSDGCYQPIGARRLPASRHFLGRHWLLSGESGSAAILITAKETAAHLCGPPATRSRDAHTNAAVKTEKGRAQETHASSRKADLGLRFLSKCSARSAVDENLK